MSPSAMQLAGKIRQATSPEELFGDLDANDRSGKPGETIPASFAQLTDQMNAILRYLSPLPPDLSDKLLSLFEVAVAKIRSNRSDNSVS